MKLIKLSTDHYIIVDDSEIKEGDWVFNEKSKEIYPITIIEEVVYYEKKITHSTDIANTLLSAAILHKKKYKWN